MIAGSLKRLAKQALALSGIDLQQLFTRARLTSSRRRFLHAGYTALTGYDVIHHYGDVVLDESFRYVMEGFISALLAMVRATLGETEIARATFADIGDSNGIFLRALGKRGLSINMSRDVLANIDGLQTLEGALPHLPLPDGAFDYVLCFETVEHLHDPIGGLKELARLARKGVFVSVPCVSRTNLHPYWPDRARPAAEQHVFECTDEDFRKLLTYAGLRVERWVVHRVFDRPRTLSELASECWWRWRFRDEFCAVFRGFSIYHLLHDRVPVGREGDWLAAATVEQGCTLPR